MNKSIRQRNREIATRYLEDVPVEHIAAAYGLTPSAIYGIAARQPARRRRRSPARHPITAWGETKSLSQWVADARCRNPYAVVYARLRLGWAAEDAMQQPVASRARQLHGVKHSASDALHSDGFDDRDYEPWFPPEAV